jgi:hypothetical protein
MDLGPPPLEGGNTLPLELDSCLLLKLGPATATIWPPMGMPFPARPAGYPYPFHRS